MTDDRDRDEWANVSFDTGSPGLSETESREPKMVVCCIIGSLVFSLSSEYYLSLNSFNTVLQQHLLHYIHSTASFQDNLGKPDLGK